MKKLALILRILEHVPVPYVPETAVLLEQVLADVQAAQEQDAAVAAQSLTEWRAAVAEAAAADASVWTRIRARANGVQDAGGTIVTGSTGD